MKYRKLGESSLVVSNMAFGCWAIVGGFNWGPQDKKDSLNALNTAFDLGITLFDTAEGYGDGKSERMIAEALSSKRDQIVIASKVLPNHYAPAELVMACERSLKNLQTDRIDLYQLHWPNPEIPIAETLGIMERLKEQGKIREYGVSNFGVKNLEGCFEAGYQIVSDQLAYNLLFRAIEYRIKPFCIEHHIGVLCYSPLLQGLLTGKFASAADVPDDRARTRHFPGDRSQARHGEAGCETESFQTIAALRNISEEFGRPMAEISLAWLLNQPGVSSVLMSGRNASQVKQNLQAAELNLSPDVILKLNRATETLKQKLGENADLWQGGINSRIS